MCLKCLHVSCASLFGEEWQPRIVLFSLAEDPQDMSSLICSEKHNTNQNVVCHQADRHFLGFHITKSFSNN